MVHQAIWNKNDTNWPVCGIPEKFYTDHGSGFTSNHMEQVAIDLKINLVWLTVWKKRSIFPRPRETPTFENIKLIFKSIATCSMWFEVKPLPFTSNHMEQVAIDLKINLMFSKVGVSRGRGKIERFFQTVNQTFLEQLPGYIIIYPGSCSKKVWLTVWKKRSIFPRPRETPTFENIKLIFKSIATCSMWFEVNGSGFTSNHMEQVAIDLKINLMFSKVGVSRGRGKIERFFQTVNQTKLIFKSIATCSMWFEVKPLPWSV